MKYKTVSLTMLCFGQAFFAMEMELAEKELPTIEKKGVKMIDIGISEINRKEMAKILNRLLANEYVLYTKTWKYHWNVQGKHFGALHKFFQDQFEKLAEIIDEVAERSLMLGIKADGTLAEFLQKTTLPELPGQNPDELTMIQHLLADHEIIIKQLRENIDTSAQINDMGTNNFLSDLIEKHEKMAWMLRAHLTA